MAPQRRFSESVQACANRLVRCPAGGLTELFDLTSMRLVRYATTLLRNQHDAEDVVQAVLARVADEPRRLSRAQNAWGYLLQMTRNEALMLVRRRRRCTSVGSLGDCIDGDDLNVRRRVDEVEQQELHRNIWLAIREIPVEQAEVVVLRIWEGMTFLQISQLLDVSANTVASRYQYAISKLGQKLSKLVEESVR